MCHNVEHVTIDKSWNVVEKLLLLSPESIEDMCSVKDEFGLSARDYAFNEFELDILHNTEDKIACINHAPSFAKYLNVE